MENNKNMYLIEAGERPMFGTKKWLKNLKNEYDRSGIIYSQSLAFEAFSNFVNINAFKLKWHTNANNRGQENLENFLSLALIFPKINATLWEQNRHYEKTIEKGCINAQRITHEYEGIITSGEPSRGYELNTECTKQVWTAWFEDVDSDSITDVLNESLAFWLIHIKTSASKLQFNTPQLNHISKDSNSLSRTTILISQMQSVVLDSLWKYNGEDGVVELLSILSDINQSQIFSFIKNKTEWSEPSNENNTWCGFWQSFFGGSWTLFRDIVKGLNIEQSWTKEILISNELVEIPEVLKQNRKNIKFLIWGGNKNYRTSVIESLFQHAGENYKTINDSEKISTYPLKIQLLPESNWLFKENEWKKPITDWTTISKILKCHGMQVFECDTFDAQPDADFDVVFNVGDWPLKEKILATSKNFINETDIWRISQHLHSPNELKHVIRWCEITGDFSWSNVKNLFLQQEILRRSVNKEKSLLALIDPTDVNFIGDESTEAWLIELINFLNKPALVDNFFVKKSGGVLLSGSPGTGKTHFVKNLSKLSNIPIYSANSSELSKNIANISICFEQARRLAPCILFIDEVDVLCSNPVSKLDMNEKVQEITNAFLAEMDGIKTQDGVFVIGATHRVQLLDPAAVRPGRFTENRELQMPDTKTRARIWNAHLDKIPKSDININNLVDASIGFSGAEIRYAVEIGALNAAKLMKLKVEQTDLEQACTDIAWGAVKDSEQMHDVLWKVSIHEAGHALMALSLGKEVVRVTVRPRQQGFNGAVQMKPLNDGYSRTKLEEEITVLLSGIAAEMSTFGSYDNGGSSDLSVASELMGHGVWFWGLGKTLGPKGTCRIFKTSEKVTAEIDKECVDWNKILFNDAVKFFNKNKQELESLATLFMNKKEISSVDIKKWKQEYMKKN